ncbi:MFS transporter [Bacillus sp. DNRA2]|uniref:MDR family MFS transporter n=1 Tax=Bacillus sp. DNRA2 TaxID=2723053 RepID=UPI00145D7D48|nr:MFS transporter [Bacillus sp. DNRA2]NMD72165.1 MFS transporter [Bacillus sp. DNRA2]
MPRAVWLLVIGMAVNVTGASFLWPLNSIYIHEHLGKSLTIAGVVLMLNSGASVIGNLLGGRLFDKFGGYRSILLGIVITLLALIGLSCWNGWPAYVIFLTIIGLGTGIVFPSMYAMAGTVWKEGGRRAFNAIYVASNLGVAIGSSLGGIVAAISFQWIFIANAILYAIFLIIAFFGYKGINRPEAVNVAKEQTASKVRKVNAQLTALFILCIGYMLCWIGYSQWQATVAPYTQELGISLREYSYLWTINGALIVLGQPFLNRLVISFAKTVKSQIVIGTIIFAVAFLVASLAQSFAGFAIGMVIMTIGEMLVWPAVPTIADKLAPVGKEGFYQGIANSAATGGRMLGPIIGGMLVDFYNMQTLFIVMIGLFLLSLITTFSFDRKITNKNNISMKAS